MPYSRNRDVENDVARHMELENRSSIIPFFYDEVSSVLDVAKEVDGLLPGQVALIAAKRQLLGRGQQGRVWTSQDEAFLGCLLFPNAQISRSDVPAFSLVIALEVAKLLSEYGVNAKVKWPNDVLVSESYRKICGVLLEFDSSLRVGIGVNLRGSPEDATSVVQEIGNCPTLPEFSAKLAQRCVSAFKIFELNLFPAFIDQWKQYDILFGQELEFTQGKEIFSGIGAGVDSVGRLKICVDGEEIHFSSGRVRRKNV